MVGDASDNIPGVKGVGSKTASDLLREFKTIEEVFDSIAIIPQKVAKKLEGQKEIAFLSKELATIKRDVPLELNALEDVAVKPSDKTEITNYFKNLGFHSLINKL